MTCDEAGGDFQFSGCTENVCSAGSGDRTGYKVCQYDATDIDAPVAEAMGVAGTCEALLNDPCGVLRPASRRILCHLYDRCTHGMIFEPLDRAETWPREFMSQATSQHVV